MAGKSTSKHGRGWKNFFFKKREKPFVEGKKPLKLSIIIFKTPLFWLAYHEIALITATAAEETERY